MYSKYLPNFDFLSGPKKNYSKNSKMTCLRKKNPRTKVVIPNVKNIMLKIS
jgi:hypothetical protein